MIHSMTGFARAESHGEGLTLGVTVRAVNHRFLDLKIRTPPELEHCDPLIRRTVKKRVRRGALQISVTLTSEKGSRLELNRPAAEAYLKAYRELAALADDAGPLDLSALLRAPGIVSSDHSAPSQERARDLEAHLDTALGQALAQLNEARAEEGRGVGEEIRGRARTIAAETAQLKEAVSGVSRAIARRLEKRLADLLSETGVEPQRLAQEAALLADRADISEELQRLAAHAERLLALLEAGGEVGKQIDFLAQEMNREANTTLSKTGPLGADGLVVSECGLRLKAEIEKIREQAQNLE